MCKATQQQLIWFCNSFDSKGIDDIQTTITDSDKLDAQKCKFAKKTITVKLCHFSKSRDFDFDKTLILILILFSNH